MAPLLDLIVVHDHLWRIIAEYLAVEDLLRLQLTSRDTNAAAVSLLRSPAYALRALRRIIIQDLPNKLVQKPPSELTQSERQRALYKLQPLLWPQLPIAFWPALCAHFRIREDTLSHPFRRDAAYVYEVWHTLLRDPDSWSSTKLANLKYLLKSTAELAAEPVDFKQDRWSLRFTFSGLLGFLDDPALFVDVERLLLLRKLDLDLPSVAIFAAMRSKQHLLDHLAVHRPEVVRAAADEIVTVMIHKDYGAGFRSLLKRLPDLRLRFDGDQSVNATSNSLLDNIKYSEERDLGPYAFLAKRAVDAAFPEPVALIVPGLSAIEAHRVLYHAASLGNLDIVQLVIDAGADPAAHTPDGTTALHGAVAAAVAAASIQIADLLRRRGANLDATDAAGKTALVAAIEASKPEFARWLLAHGADPEVATNDGLRPIHLAARKHRPDWVAMLRAAGADPAATDPRGNSPAHLAAAAGNLPVLAALLDVAAAATTATTPSATAAAACAPTKTVSADAATAAAAVAATTAAPTDLHLLLNADQDSLLHAAARGGNPAIVHALLGRGCSPRLFNRDRRTPLDVACRAGRMAAADALLAAATAAAISPC